MSLLLLAIGHDSKRNLDSDPLATSRALNSQMIYVVGGVVGVVVVGSVVVVVVIVDGVVKALAK